MTMAASPAPDRQPHDSPSHDSHKAFLLALSDATRRLADPDAILTITLERLGRQLGVSRVGYIENHDDGRGFSIRREWREGIAAYTGEHDAAGTSPHLQAALARGEAMVIDDVLADPALGVSADTLLASGARAALCVPLIRAGQLVGALGLAHTVPHHWRPEDLALVRDVLERTWETLERARAEAALRDSEALLQAFFQHAPLAMSLADDEGRLLLANPELGRRLGAAVPALIGTVPEGEAALRAEVVAGNRAIARELAGDPAAASWRESLAIRFPVRADAEAPLRIGGFDIDLTRQKAMEAELARSREALFQSEKLTALGALLAGVSHELNNPLSVVVGQALILEQKAADPALKARAAKIRTAAERCARIVQTFLAMARQRPPERQPLDINDLVAAALELTAYGLRAAGVSVTRAFAADLPALVGDAGQLHQLFANLIINAQHALADRAGARELAITTRHRDGMVEVDFADTGPGVPDDLRHRVFEPFFTTRPVGAGTGLGLSFAYNVALAHGGRLDLCPSPRGALFRLSLPVAGPSAAAAVPAPPPAAAGHALVIDDEAELAETLAELLQARGWTTQTATSGAAALAALDGGRFDLVLTDVRMPGLDGPALYGWQCANRPDLAARTAFVTGDTLGAQASAFLAGAGRPFAEKPLSADSIDRLLAAALPAAGL